MFGRLQSRRGFTMIEILAVLGIIAVLAALLTPSVIKHIQSAKLSRAEHDVGAIAAAVGAFYKDMGRWPTDLDSDHSPGDQEVAILRSHDGDMPDTDGQGDAWADYDPPETFKNQLLLNKPGGARGNKYPITGSNKWNGPYLVKFKPDPWGRKYLCNVGVVRPGERRGPVWVISAGPDGILQSSPRQYELKGDDIGILLEG